MDTGPCRPPIKPVEPPGLDRRRCLGGLCLLAGLARGAGAAVPREATGPRRVLFLVQDYRNGGITKVYRSFEEACRELGWQLHVANGEGDRAKLVQLFEQALRARVDGVVLGGFDEGDFAEALARHSGSAPVLVGWHAASRPGPTATLFANVSSDPLAVADMAAALVLQTAPRRAGVVIFNDSRFEIANVKTQRMREALLRSGRCDILAVEDLPISQASRDVPAALARLQQRFGPRWTHLLAINDAYMDSMHFPLQDLGRGDIVGIAAGDGSRTALSRIRSGRSQQVATIAEPAGMQGWQLADELHRAFQGLPHSGRVAQPVAVTTDYLRNLGGGEIDDALPFRAEYRQQWRVPASAPRSPSSSSR
ncbi:substrate-binding domain-containing protein [Roseateles sp.]|uniref:substrate-binding domain-containing protein n=1 Tax=Roseateles sp. TaxID=1971397 RepID=UPI0032637570